MSESAAKAQRVLACVLCQQRKVKCDRKFPCSNCTKHNVRCVPATKTRPRRRRFPERELLDRLRKYEDLMRQHNVRFEPLHPEHGPTPESYDSDNEERDADSASPSTAIKSEEQGVSSTSVLEKLDDDNFMSESMRESLAKRAWDHLVHNDDNILFGSSLAAVDLSTLHPEPVHIFRLWQAYLDNVNPILKVTHTPTLQPRIIEAASNLNAISPDLEALMFSIYCMSLLSIPESECQSVMGMAKDDLLIKYRFGCQQALLNAGFLRTHDRECLTALHLYLLSAMSLTHPQSLSSMLGVAMRIAQRMGIHNESSNSKHTILEAEMRRRLWWSLVMFDSRICELANAKVTYLDLTWDCHLPLNVSDSDLRDEMKEPPSGQLQMSESVFSVVRAEMGNALRQSSFYLNLVNPRLALMIQPSQQDQAASSLAEKLEQQLEQHYFRFCNEDNPLHLMTMWTARIFLSKYSMIERITSSEANDGSRNLKHAFRMLECDTNILSNPALRGYIWYLNAYFPFPAYLHIVRNIKQETPPEIAERAWKLMNDNFEARFSTLKLSDNSSFKALAGITLQAWEVLDAGCRAAGNPMKTPEVVTRIKERIAQAQQDTENMSLSGSMSDDANNYAGIAPMLSMDFGNFTFGEVNSGQSSGFGIDLGSSMGMNSDAMNLGNMDWAASFNRGW